MAFKSNCNTIIFVIVTLILTGCGSNKGLVQLEQVEMDSKEILILKDVPTRETVLPVLTEWFYENGFSAEVIHSLDDVNPEDYVFTYRAWWGWDLATYMSKVRMKVESNGETLGHLYFDALQYGGFGKFGDAEYRLKVLLDALFGKITREEADALLDD